METTLERAEKKIEKENRASLKRSPKKEVESIKEPMRDLGKIIK
jgi:hypothetical protein